LSLYKRGNIYWYNFLFGGRHIQESAKTTKRTVAKLAEQNRRRDCERAYTAIGYNAIEERKQRVNTFSRLAADKLRKYRLTNVRSATFAEYAVRHLTEHLGSKLIGQIDDHAVTDYQIKRLEQKASPKSINEEVGVLLRFMEDRGDIVRSKLKRDKKLKLKVGAQPGKKFEVDEKDRMLLAAKTSRSPLILPALTLALNAGMRDAEIRTTQWSQIDFSKRILTVGKSKTDAGTGRRIPLNSEILAALLEHARWYTKKFGELRLEWYVFPYGRRGHMDTSRPITTLKTSWSNVRKTAGVKGRWHDTRHTLISELGESGAGSETIKGIAGHVSEQMLKRYSHIGTQAKRDALEDVLKHRQEARDLKAAEKEAAQVDAAPTVN
jgi:integrase